MYNYSNEEYADFIYYYGLAQGNACRAARLYTAAHPSRRRPHMSVFQATYRRLRESGSVSTTREYSRRRSSDVTTEEAVLELVRRSPGLSIRRICLRTGLTQTSVWRILHEAKMHPYHLTPVQDILSTDLDKRRQFCTLILDRDFDDHTFLDNILWTDESQFTKTGVTNFHNAHLWSRSNPHGSRRSSTQHRFAVNVWAGVIGNILIGPHVLPPRLNSDSYLEFLQHDLPGLLEDVPLQTRRNMIYQHDGAPAHSTTRVINWLQEKYHHKVIGRNAPISWPPRSPDLTPMDFYLWGHFKEIVYEVNITSEEQLKERIEDAALRIREELQTTDLKRSIRRRFWHCIQNNGGLFEHILNS